MKELLPGSERLSVESMLRVKLKLPVLQKKESRAAPSDYDTSWITSRVSPEVVNLLIDRFGTRLSLDEVIRRLFGLPSLARVLKGDFLAKHNGMKSRKAEMEEKSPRRNKGKLYPTGEKAWPMLTPRVGKYD